MSKSRVRNFMLRSGTRVSNNTWFVVAALLVSVAAAWPLISQSGLLNTRGGGDSPFLLQRLHQLVAALTSGHFPVRWMPDANYGFGYPFYNYYAPLSIYIAAFFRFLGFSYVQAIKLAQLSGFLVAAWAMYQLGRRWLVSPWAGLLAAAAYTLAPFHMVNVYVRGDSLAEFWAMALYPLALITLDHLLNVSAPRATSTERIIIQNRKVAAALFALVYAALILSHNISAMIFTPFLLLYLIIWVLMNGRTQQSTELNIKNILGMLKWPLLALLLALFLSAWFWLPALAESSIAQLEPVTSGYFHFSNHFRDNTLIQRVFFFDYDVSGGRPFSMGLIQAVVLLAGLFALFLIPQPDTEPAAGDQGAVNRLRRVPVQRLFIVLGLLIATFMVTSLSRPLWDSLSLLQFAQFPWRFLSIQALFGALATAGITLLPGRRYVVPITIALILIASLGKLKTDFLILSDADVTAEKLAQYEWFTGNIGSTVSAEYLPRTVQPRPYTGDWLNIGDRDAVQLLDGTLSSAKILERYATRQRWLMNATTPGATLTFPTKAWPDWRATIDDQPAEIIAAPGSGKITLRLPSGEHEVTLHLTRTPIRIVGEILAVVGILVVFWLLRRQLIKKPHRSLLALVAVLILVAILLRLIPARQLSGEDLTWDFAHMAYLHHDENGVRFDNGVTLLSYEYSAGEVAAGEEIQIKLFWEAMDNEEVALALATPAINRFELAPLLIDQTQTIASNEAEYRLVIPVNSPAGLYVPRVTMSGALPLAPSGQTRGDLFLRPIRVLDVPQSVNDDASFFDARALQVKQRDFMALDVQLLWLTQQALTRNYNFSLRVTDASGNVLAQLDGQPGYGFQPSSGWPAGVWVDDWLTIPLLADFPRTAGDLPFGLVVRLYDVESGEIVLVRRLGELVWMDSELVFRPTERVRVLPDDLLPANAHFGEGSHGPFLGLRGYLVDQSEKDLDIDLFWQASGVIEEDFYHFVHLVDPDTGEIVAQHDSMPREDSYPTSQWTAGEIVDDRITLDISEIHAGDYELYVGLYRLVDGEPSRLPVVDREGQRLTNDRLKLIERIVVAPG